MPCLSFLGLGPPDDTFVITATIFEHAKKPDAANISEWLWNNNQYKYTAVFRENDIKTFDDVVQIGEADLMSFGITCYYDRKQLLKMIESKFVEIF